MYTHIMQVGMRSTRTQTHVTIVATLCASPHLGLPKWASRQDRLGSPALHFRGATNYPPPPLPSILSQPPTSAWACTSPGGLETFWSEEINSATNPNFQQALQC